MATRTKKVKKITTNTKRTTPNKRKGLVKVESAVRTQVYEIQDPSARLIATIGAAMFNEPQYYPTDPMTQKRTYEYKVGDMDSHAQMIINTATEIAKSDHPEDLLKIARWARKELNIRTTPQVLLAVAAHMEETKPFVREYCGHIVQRADELKDVFVASRALFGSEKSLPNSLKRGLADAFQKFGEYDFLKYEGQQRPYFADVLKMVDRATNYPLPKALDHYLKTGEIQNPEQLPLATARQALAKLTEFNNEAKALATTSRANWEVLISQFGNKKEVWEHLISTKALPYMATMRNVRNILEAGVSNQHIQQVCEYLVGHAVQSKQLPFRFMTARAAINPPANTNIYAVSKIPHNDQQKSVYNALGQAFDTIVMATPSIPGSTLVATDTSGSMESSISAKSTMTMREAGMVLASICAKRCENVTVGVFADTWHVLPPKEYKGAALDVVDALKAMGINGGTSAESVLRWAIQQKKKFDRIIIISDMQTYNSTSYYRPNTAIERMNVQQLISLYRKTINKNCKLHCIDLAGHSQSLVPENDPQSNLVAGFSEKLLNLVLEFEGINLDTEGETKPQAFTLEYIRANY